MMGDEYIKILIDRMRNDASMLKDILSDDEQIIAENTTEISGLCMGITATAQALENVERMKKDLEETTSALSDTIHKLLQ
jgi:ubiquinone biosynthesis protein UbiJ